MKGSISYVACILCVFIKLVCYSNSELLIEDIYYIQEDISYLN